MGKKKGFWEIKTAVLKYYENTTNILRKYYENTTKIPRKYRENTFFGLTYVFCAF